jgi:hypothetical protein
VPYFLVPQIFQIMNNMFVVRDIFSAATLTTSLLVFVVIYLIGTLIASRYKHGFSAVPGPLLASFTDLWRLMVVYHGRFDLRIRALHHKHGDLVRVGPNCFSIADPKEIKNIYGIKRLFPKVGMTYRLLLQRYKCLFGY